MKLSTICESGDLAAARRQYAQIRKDIDAVNHQLKYLGYDLADYASNSVSIKYEVGREIIDGDTITLTRGKYKEVLPVIGCPDVRQLSPEHQRALMDNYDTLVQIAQNKRFSEIGYRAMLQAIAILLVSPDDWYVYTLDHDAVAFDMRLTESIIDPQNLYTSSNWKPSHIVVLNEVIVARKDQCRQRNIDEDDFYDMCEIFAAQQHHRDLITHLNNRLYSLQKQQQELLSKYKTSELMYVSPEESQQRRSTLSNALDKITAQSSLHNRSWEFK